MTAIPISIRDVAPGDGAIRLTGTQATGLPSGTHTGGAWLWDNRVWKPLDGRFSGNGTAHYPTLEDVVLTEVAGAPLFPKNWTVEERNGRRFLVREIARLIPEDVPYAALTPAQLNEIITGIMVLNRRKWEVNDALALAIDPSGALFIYDMSAAQRMPGIGAFAADDSGHLHRWLEAAGHGEIVKRHNNAFHALVDIQMPTWLEGRQVYPIVYGAFARPVSRSEIERLTVIPFDVVEAECADPAAEVVNGAQVMPYSWIFIDQHLDTAAARALGLEYVWEPTHQEIYRAERRKRVA